jgi:hypothetical protein
MTGKAELPVPMSVFSASLAEGVRIKPFAVALHSRAGHGWPDTFSIWRILASRSGTVLQAIFS